MNLQTSYQLYPKRAHAGLISDSSFLQVDGCTAATTNIIPGTVAIIKANDRNTKTVAAATTPADVNSINGGVVSFSHAYCAQTEDGKSQYQIGQAVNVVREGRVWAITSLTTAPSFGTPVSVSANSDNTAGIVSSGGNPIPGWLFTGEFEFIGGNSYIAEVQLRMQTAEAAATTNP